jgi:hypothetical protein
MAIFYVPSPPDDNITPQKGQNSETLFLLTVGGTPFKPRFWSVEYYDDAAVWVGSPTSDNTLRLLTEGGQPPTPRWLPRYTQDDPSVWQYAFHQNLTLLGNEPLKPYFWQYNYDDAAVWSGSPTADNTLRLLTEGGQPPTPKWLPRYTQDDSSFWQYAFNRNIALLAPNNPLKPSFWQFGQDDPSVWTGSPTSDETLRLLTEQTPQKPNFWKYDYDEGGFWVGSPTSDNTIRLLTQGGQPPTPEWLPRYTQDDPTFWQGTPVPRNYALYNLLAPVPFRNPQFNQFVFDDHAVWSGSPTSDETLRLLTEQTPQKPYFWKNDYDEGGIWVGSPTSDNTIRMLTVGGQPPTPEWLPRYTQDDSAFWAGAPVPRNYALYQSLIVHNPFVPSFPNFVNDDPPVTDRQISLQRFLGQADIRFTPTAKPSFWTSIEDSPFWQGQPVPSWLIRELTQQTPLKPYLWKSDYDDPGLWYQPLHKNLALKTSTFQAAWAVNSNIVMGGVAT